MSRRRKLKGRGRRARSATKKHTRRSKRTTIIIETQDGWGPKRTTVYEQFYEQEW